MADYGYNSGNFDKIVRILCDSISFKDGVEFSNPLFKLEIEKSGNIEWLNCKSFNKL